MNTTDNRNDNYEEHLEVKTDQIQSNKTEDYIFGFEVTKLGEIIKEMRERQHLSREELAQKCGTSSYYISKIENNLLDIPISALSSIIRLGLNGQLELRVRL